MHRALAPTRGHCPDLFWVHSAAIGTETTTALVLCPFLAKAKAKAAPATPACTTEPPTPAFAGTSVQSNQRGLEEADGTAKDLDQQAAAAAPSKEADAGATAVADHKEVVPAASNADGIDHVPHNARHASKVAATQADEVRSVDGVSVEAERDSFCMAKADESVQPTAVRKVALKDRLTARPRSNPNVRNVHAERLKSDRKDVES